MTPCQTCQEQFLEYLYDLLEPTERQEIESHLAECSICQHAFQKAKSQQQLLASAARMQFPNVQFVAPGSEGKHLATSPDILPLPVPVAKYRSKSNWRKWALAASVLIASSFALPAGYFGLEYLDAKRTIHLQESTIGERLKELNETQTRLAQVILDRDKEVNAAIELKQKQQLQVQIEGPSSLTAGHSNEFQIITKNLANERQSVSNLVARVIDEQGKPSEPIQLLANGLGDYRAVLPPQLTDLRPGLNQNSLNLMVSAQKENFFSAELNSKIEVHRPVSLTYLATDKPMYQPGEVVRFRSLTVDKASLKPTQQPISLVYTVTPPVGGEELVVNGKDHLQKQDEKGKQPVNGPDGKPLQGVGAGELALKYSAVGGEWTLTVREKNNQFLPVNRKFLVNQYQKPRLNKELDFTRKSFSPGEEYQAWCKATRADGGPLANQPVTVGVTIDGLSFNLKGEPSNTPDQLGTDAEGRVKLSGKLPQQIEKGQGSVSVTFTDGGSVETLVRPLPIVLKDLQIEFFPEGGDLVADLPVRVYFQARTPLGKPAEIKGLLLEDLEPTGIEVNTLNDEREVAVNQGMGRFAFTPKQGKKYQIKIVSPPGITRPILLAEPLEQGVVMRIDESILSGKQSLKVHLETKQPGKHLVAVYCRDRQVAIANLDAKQSDIEIALGEDVAGVCRVTAYAVPDKDGGSGQLKPLAERLIFRRSDKNLNVVIKPDRNRYVPRQKVRLDVEALDEKESPTPAVVALSVVDKSVVTMADEKTARTPTTYFLLTGGIKNGEELEYSDFLLTQKPHAAEALDLLLGTRGWRRFVPASSTANGDPSSQLKLASGMAGAGRGGQIEDATKQALGVDGAAALPAPVAVVNNPLIAVSPQSQVFQKAIRDEKEKIVNKSVPMITQINQEIEEATANLKQATADQRYWKAKDNLTQAQQGLATLYYLALPVLLTLFFFLLIRAIYLTLSQSHLSASSLVTLGVLGSLLLGLGGLTWFFIDPRFAPDKKSAHASRTIQEAEPKKEIWHEKAIQPADVFNAPNGEMMEAEWGLKQEATPMAPAQRDRAKEMVGEPEKNIPAAMAKSSPRAMKKHAMVPQTQTQNIARAAKDRLEMKADLREAPSLIPAPGGPRVAGGAIADEIGGKPKASMINGIQAVPPGIAGGFGKRILDRDQTPIEMDLDLVVREYAHQNASAFGETRSDFTETLLWHPLLVMSQGKGSASFDLSDSVTSFQVTAYAHTLDGRFGTGTYELESRLPFTLQPKIPIEVTSSDKILLPLSVANNTPGEREIQVELAQTLGVVRESGSQVEKLSVQAEKARRQLYGLRPSITEGEASLEFRGSMAGYGSDAIRMGFRVVPLGFPISGSQSDVLEGSALANIKLPKNWVTGSLHVKAEVYPSTLATLQKGLEGLLREPNGCFEQSSTTNYPNVLVLDYLRESNATQPELEKQTRALLDRGYQKLVSFECQADNQKRLGYEWFGGQAPPHEALTAYGLMQFRDMSRVFDVDREMVKRTQDYLLKQRDGKGGFHRNPRALDSFGRAPEVITNAYILWALTESGIEENLDIELKAMQDQAKDSKDPYFLALVANGLINRGQTAPGTTILERLVTLQKADGHLDGEVTSITGSGGQALQIETTSLAILGWLKAQPGKFNKSVEKAINWVSQQRAGQGAFGSTQSTILALKALISHTRANKKTAEAGEISFFVGEQKVATTAFAAGASGTLLVEVPDAEKIFKAGDNKVRLEITGKNVFPYTISWNYSTTLPQSNADCKVRLQAGLARKQIEEGETVSLDVKVKNLTKSGQGMTTAIVGIPAGLTIPEDLKQLKDLTSLPEDGSRPKLGAFEIRGRELVLHWRDLAPGEEVGLKIDLIGRVPGTYTGPASRAYLYYTAEQKNWIAPLEVSIAPRN